MSEARPTESPIPGKPWKIVVRVMMILCVAFLIGWFLNQMSVRLDRDARPAGFGRGVVQGALMPMSLPNLLVGNDVIIYSGHNTGLTYKLGYTFGVNACGLLFFGFLFWRLNRWRKH
jgi:hypothetical protein